MRGNGRDTTCRSAAESAQATPTAPRPCQCVSAGEMVSAPASSAARRRRTRDSSALTGSQTTVATPLYAKLVAVVSMSVANLASAVKTPSAMIVTMTSTAQLASAWSPLAETKAFAIGAAGMGWAMTVVRGYAAISATTGSIATTAETTPRVGFQRIAMMRSSSATCHSAPRHPGYLPQTARRAASAPTGVKRNAARICDRSTPLGQALR